jgi:hypothetical protein
VEDQETSPSLDDPEGEPELDDEDEPEDEDAGPPARGSLLSTSALLGFAAVLVVFAMLMTALYAHERGVRADDERLLGASNAQLNAVQDQLNTARGGPSLDPKGYEAIKQCVQQSVEERRTRDEIQQQLGLSTAFPTALPTGGSTMFITTLPPGAVLNLPPGTTLPDSVICEDALTYLK